MRMRIHPSYLLRRRRGFTLLEIVLAVSVGVVLMFALYMALSLQFQHASTAREIMAETNLVGRILAKINSDVNPIQGPQNPFLSAAGAYVNSDSASNLSMGGTPSTTASTTSNMNPVNMAMTNLGVRGDDSCVIFTVSRTPRDNIALIGNGPPAEPLCDLRRITYCVVNGQGLVRKEDRDITNSDYTTPTSLPPDLGDISKNVIASQVKVMTLSYFGTDGQWTPDWDGSTMVPLNGNSSTYAPQGPPALIKFTLTLELPPYRGSTTMREVTVEHMIAIQTANRFVQSSAPQ